MESPEDLKIQERNAFLDSLAIAARERFLEALQRADSAGLDEEAAWQEAVVAAETTYAPETAYPGPEPAPLE